LINSKEKEHWRSYGRGQDQLILAGFLGYHDFLTSWKFQEYTIYPFRGIFLIGKLAGCFDWRWGPRPKEIIEKL